MVKKVLKWIGIILAAIIVLAVGFVGVLTIVEYRPNETDKMAVENQVNESLKDKSTFTIMTWNIGYGALGDNADFFMDGGTMVSSSTKERVEENVDAISGVINDVSPDFLFLQEVDKKSKRSHKVNEYDIISNNLFAYENSYATNYRVLYVPYPLPTIGTVECGISTFSKYTQSSSTRVSLPCPFSWPTRLANLKRCLLVDRVPIEGTDKELVLINLHLEAYDEGEGKAAQTKQLRELIESEMKKGNYVIAGGDFNQTFSSADDSLFPIYGDNWVPPVIDTDEFDSTIQFVMDETKPSCRLLDRPYKGADTNNFQYYLIDGFIVSGNIKINSYETKDLDFKNSDHNPLVMNVTLE